jgi:hypothetical protein
MYYTSDKIREGEMGWTCGSDGEKENCVHNFGGENGWKETTWKV